MKRFPKEFADLLSPAGKRILQGNAKSLQATFQNGHSPFVLLPNMIEKTVAEKCCQLLSKVMYDKLKRIESPIPSETISAMTENYTEQLPKTLQMKTAYFRRKSSADYQAAESIGLLELMRSDSFAQFASVVSGYELYKDNGRQVILYEHGNYAGPHNDHHPENEYAKDGFLDIHVMFSNSTVAHHWLVYQDNAHFSKIVDITQQGAIAIYRLPFWHYTTPLVGKPKREKQARRWVLLGSFNIVQNPS
jgi:hypothetical protein